MVLRIDLLLLALGEALAYAPFRTPIPVRAAAVRASSTVACVPMVSRVNAYTRLACAPCWVAGRRAAAKSRTPAVVASAAAADDAEIFAAFVGSMLDWEADRRDAEIESTVRGWPVLVRQARSDALTSAIEAEVAGVQVRRPRTLYCENRLHPDIHIQSERTNLTPIRDPCPQAAAVVRHTDGLDTAEARETLQVLINMMVWSKMVFRRVNEEDNVANS